MSLWSEIYRRWMVMIWSLLMHKMSCFCYASITPQAVPACDIAACVNHFFFRLFLSQWFTVVDSIYIYLMLRCLESKSIWETKLLPNSSHSIWCRAQVNQPKVNQLKLSSSNKPVANQMKPHQSFQLKPISLKALQLNHASQFSLKHFLLPGSIATERVSLFDVM